jgi:hypothetical protein
MIDKPDEVAPRGMRDSVLRGNSGESGQQLLLNPHRRDFRSSASSSREPRGERPAPSEVAPSMLITVFLALLTPLLAQDLPIIERGRLGSVVIGASAETVYRQFGDRAR